MVDERKAQAQRDLKRNPPPLQIPSGFRPKLAHRRPTTPPPENGFCFRSRSNLSLGGIFHRFGSPVRRPSQARPWPLICGRRCVAGHGPRACATPPLRCRRRHDRGGTSSAVLRCFKRGKRPIHGHTPPSSPPSLQGGRCWGRSTRTTRSLCTTSTQHTHNAQHTPHSPCLLRTTGTGTSKRPLFTSPSSPAARTPVPFGGYVQAHSSSS